mmetsp:Transcript_38477/g.93091  ORF Transcript_38477/g.93091 Transcript_38477/m.93091 type:complete len:91 (-) Transcript_38477:98-370(-)
MKKFKITIQSNILPEIGVGSIFCGNVDKFSRIAQWSEHDCKFTMLSVDIRRQEDFQMWSHLLAFFVFCGKYDEDDRSFLIYIGLLRSMKD